MSVGSNEKQAPHPYQKASITSTFPSFLIGITEEIPNDVIAVRTDLPQEIKEKIHQILSEYIATEEGQAIMDEIYGWTDLVPAVNSEFDVVREAAEEFGLYDN